MADQSIALQVQPVGPMIDPATPLLNAEKIQYGQTELQRAKSQLARDEETHDLSMDAGRTSLQRLNRVNQGEDIQYRSQLIRDAAAHAQDPQSWDAAMRAAVKNGAPEAAQYVGRYTPLLQQRLFDSYAGAAPQQGSGATSSLAQGQTSPSDSMDRQFQKATPQQMGEIVRQGDIFLRALSTVKDQASQDQAAAALRAAGVPDQALQGPFSGPKIVNLWNEVSQRNNYLSKRLTPGAQEPLVKNDTKSVGGVEYSVDPYKGTATPLTPPVQKVVPDSYDKSGNPLFYTEQGGLVPPGGGVSVAEAARRTQGVENNTGNPDAKNPRSTATGNGQFIERTWLDTVKEARPELAKALNDKQLLALRSDPQFSSEMTEALAKNNIASLSKAGLPVTTATVALAHRFGSGDVTKLLNANPKTPMEELFPPKDGKPNPVMAANPDLAGKTAGDVAQETARKVGNDPVEVPGEQKVFHKGQYENPKLVETDDGKGGTERVMAQQDKRTGQWVTANEKRTPINSDNLVILPESMMGGGGGRNAAMVTRTLTAARDATSEIKNIVELPLESSSGWFGGAQNAQPHSLMTAAKNVLAQKVTSQDVQDFNTSMIGMGKALAALESGGMQTNQALIAQFDRLALLEGDTQLTKMRKLATMRQQADNALEANMTSPYMGKAQKELSKKIMDELKTAVPWTPSDVTKLQRSDNPTASLGDFAKSKGLDKGWTVKEK